MSESRSIMIRSESDVINARLQTRQMAKDAGLQILDQARISLAVSSLAHMIRLGETHQGQIIINRINDDGRAGVQVVWLLAPNDDCKQALESLDDSSWALMVDDVDISTASAEEISITAVKWADGPRSRMGVQP